MADYGINIGVNVQAQSLTRLTNQLKELIATEKKLKGQLKEAGTNTEKLNKQLEKNTERQKANKKAALDSAKAFATGSAQVRKSSAALAEQSKQLDAYRRSVKFGSGAWADFTRAIVKTNFTSSFIQLRRLNKEAETTAAAFRDMAAGGGRSGAQFGKSQSIQDLLAFKPANTTNALNAYGNALENVLVDVDRGSEMFRELAARIAEVNKQLNDTSMMKGVPTTMYKDPIGPKQRPGFFSRMRQSTRFRDIATGGGFPLLFGGGPLQALAGGIGGGAAGLGGAIAASAIASQVEAFAVSAAQAGQALQSTGGALEFVREKSLFSSKEAANLAAELEEQGKVQELATLLTDELTEVIGTSGLIALQDLGSTTDETTKLWNQLTTQLQILISGPLNGFLKLVNNILGAVNEGLKPDAKADFRAVRDRVLKTGTADQIALVQSIEEKVRGRVRKTGRGSRPGDTKLGFLGEDQALAGLELFEKAGLMPKIDVTPEDIRKITPSTTERDKLPGLEAERDKLEKLLDLEEKRFSFQQQEDEAAVLRLQAREKVARIAEEVAKIKASDLTAEQKTVALQIQGIENSRVNLELAHQLSELDRKRQEKFEDTIEGLDYQLKLARAVTEEEREQLRIEEAIRKLRQEEKLSEPQLDEIRTRMEALAEEKNLINTFIRETQEQIEKLNDPMFQMISLAKTLGSAFSESFRGIVDGSMTAQEALANLFKRTADHFLDMAAQMIAAQIRMAAVNLFMSFFNPFGGGSGFGLGSPDIGGTFGVKPKTAGLDFSGAFAGKALGGPVGAGQPYMVGERGPELFVPGAQGNIVPNNAMGSSNIVVNVDASGSSVEGDSDQAAQLGKMLGAAVQAELVKQKRPGGLLAS